LGAGERLTKDDPLLKNAFRILITVIHEKYHSKCYPNYRTEKILPGEGNPDFIK